MKAAAAALWRTNAAHMLKIKADHTDLQLPGSPASYSVSTDPNARTPNSEQGANVSQQEGRRLGSRVPDPMLRPLLGSVELLGGLKPDSTIRLQRGFFHFLSFTGHPARRRVKRTVRDQSENWET